MKLIRPALLLFITVMVASQDLYSQELLFLPWGKNDNEIGLRKAPDGHFGPMSFTVKGKKIFILDTQNKKLKVFQNSKLIYFFNLPSSYIDDFAWSSEYRYYLLEHNRIYHYDNQEIKNTFETESPRNLFTELKIVNNKVQVILNESCSKEPGQDKTITYSKNRGIEDQHGNQITIEKHSMNSITINTGSSTPFEISSSNNDLGLARYLGTTPSGDIYIYLEKIIQHIPLEVKREVLLYSRSGDIRKVIDVPLHMHTYIFSEFYVDEDGNIFHMITAKEGVYILGWFLSNEIKSNNKPYEYPAKFLRLHHYNTIEAEFPEPGDISRETQAARKFDAVSRDESLNIGNTYVQHQWMAGANNITNGRILDPNGVEIETPPWVVVGLNTKVPYKWGGFNTLAGFDNGLLSGKSAGDKATSGVSSYCVGVDCSGFVSRCWKLPSHYSTRMMDDFITVAYSRWDELQPADAIHRVGHVRLFVSENPNGSLLTVEAAGADWRVSYRSFSLSQLYDYTPRYYIYMEGSPVIIPRAKLNTLTFTDSVHMHWNFDKPDTIAGFNLYVNETENSWVYAPGGELMPATKESASFQLIQDAPIFYKVTCVSATKDLQEGYPTDIYGYYNSGGSTKVLIVDGFNRTDGSYNLSYHEFARTMGISLAGHQVSFESANNDAIMVGAIDLNNYDAVFWILGDESTVDETFDDQEQQLVKDYLLQGGKIFISGSEIAWDLDYKGSTSDKTFIYNVLKTKYDQDDSQDYTVKGATGTIFEGLTIHFDDGTHGVYEEDYPDAYLTNGGSYEAMKYENGLIAATAFEGTLSGGTVPAQILMMGFPFETIYDEAERYSLVEKLLEFFNLTTTSIGISRSLPEKHVLFDNYPNPFNLNTTIQLQISTGQFVSLEIYNQYGQKISTLVSQKLRPGIYQFKWHAAGFAEGVYYYVLKTSDGFEQTKKMVLLH
ncbi:MAG: T9SS type A sorting domain-containing protein [Bacteroidota bacterium]|nr:T9SS type A sorting domain-containing protein [Bacteroidota bacterium]